MRQRGDVQYFGVLLMSLDLPNIRAAHAWARLRSLDDRRALEYLSRLLAQGLRALADRLAPGEFLDWMVLAEEAARAIGELLAESVYSFSEYVARFEREFVGHN